MVCINNDRVDDELIVKRKGGGSIIDHKPLFSSDGHIIYIIWSNVIRAYSVQTGELLRDYEGLTDPIIAIQFHPYNSKLLIACSESGEVGTWKWKSGVYYQKTQLKLKYACQVYSFHLVGLEKDQCAILASWKYKENLSKYRVGIFILRNGELSSELNVKLKNESFQVSVGGQIGSQFLAITQSNRLHTVDINKKQTGKTRNLAEGSFFTCVECHPEYYYVLTGETTGRIVLWQGILSEEKAAQAIYHWHTLPVACLAFTQSGSHFYSGGHERVLVKWTVDNPAHRSCLPRLPGGVCHVSVGPENHRVAIATQDNGVQILDSQNRILSCIQHFAWGVYIEPKDSVHVPKTVYEPPFPAGLVYDPTTQAIVLNGHSGHVQFYSTHSKTLLYKVDITQQNQLTAERGLDIINTSVILVAIGVTSNQYPETNTWMATVEYRNDKLTHFESRLKFWEYNSAKQIFSLNTCIDHPHSERVLDVKFQSVVTASLEKQFLCATIGKDDRLKIWSLTEANAYKKTKHWRCIGSVKYKDLPINCLDFSMDGSLVSCGFGPCVTIWRPDDLALKCSLTHVGPQSNVKKVLFGNGSMGHLLVSCDSNHLVVWDVMSLRSIWMVNISVNILIADPVSTYMAAFTKDNTLFIFQPQSCEPICTKDLSKLSPIIHAVWVPNQNVYNYKINWQEYSQLYFLDSNQELLCLESNLEEDFATSSSTTSEHPHIPMTAFGAIMASQRKSGVHHSKISNTHTNLGVPGSSSVKELLIPAPHSLPPVHLLCNGLLRAMLGVSKTPAKTRSRQNIYDAEEYMEVDTSDDEDTRKSKRKDQTVQRKPKPESNKRAQDKTLEEIMKEDDEWVQNVLV